MVDKGEILITIGPERYAELFRPEAEARLKQVGIVIRNPKAEMSPEEIMSHIEDAAAIIGTQPLPRELLLKAKNLKVLAETSGSFRRNIDYETAFKKGIVILRCGAAFASAVAEMALTLALALVRNIVKYDKQMKEGTEEWRRLSDDFELRGKQVGIIGLGSVGRMLVKLLRPFGVHLCAHDPWLPEDFIKEDLGVEPRDLHTLLKTSKVIFVLAGVTKENFHLIGVEELDLIQPGAVFVNVARASLIDYEALIKRIQRGDIRVALDVFEEEPLAKDHPLRKLENVILTPHRAGGLAESYFRIGDYIANDVSQALKGLKPVFLDEARMDMISKLF